MDYLTPSLAAVLAPFWVCFRAEVFATFSTMAAAWIACLGRRTVSRVWETTGRSADHCHCPAFRLFSEAAWNWDEVGRILLVQLLAAFVPGSRIELVVDDTLCHKRGASVAFGGMFLDATLSTKRHKVFRFGTNWVTLGLIVDLPFRKGRPFCLNVLWRVCAKKDKSNPQGHRTKPQLAREMVELVASWLPGRQLVVVADQAYQGKALLKGLPEGVMAVGPIHWQAVLTSPLGPGAPKRRKVGERLTKPVEALGDDRWAWQEVWAPLPKGEKKLHVKVLTPCCWYACAGSRVLQVVLVRDPQGKWRDEALLSSDLGLTAEGVVVAYSRRWAVEVAYCDSKQRLGLHDPMVWSAKAVQRAHPMAWFCGSLVVLWYAQAGVAEPQAHRHQPWYKGKVSPTFADMLACCRLGLWREWLEKAPGRTEDKVAWLLEYVATAA